MAPFSPRNHNNSVSSLQNDHRCNALSTPMRLTSIFLAISAATAFSSGSRQVPGPFLRDSTQFSVGSSAIQSFSTQAGNEILPTRPSSALLYKHGAAEEESSNWWRPRFGQPTKTEDNHQQRVDAYLEFLDRRYRRLHGDAPQKEEKSFSAWEWLTEGSSNKNEIVATDDQREDALFALGVAGLASERLLQKYQIKVEQPTATVAHPTKDNAVDATIVDNDLVDPKVAAVGVVFASNKLVSGLRRLRAYRRLVTRFEARTLRSALSFSSKTLISTPVRASRALWRLGGGKNTVAWTVSAVALAMIVLRPIVQEAICGGSLQA